jgi:hypothetical protein
MIGKLKDYLAIAGGVAAIVAPTVGLVYYFARLEGTITKLTDRVVVLERNAKVPGPSVRPNADLAQSGRRKDR